MQILSLVTAIHTQSQSTDWKTPFYPYRTFVTPQLDGVQLCVAVSLDTEEHVRFWQHPQSKCRIRYGVFTVVDANALQMDASIFFEDSDGHLYQTVRYNDTEDRIRNCTIQASIIVCTVRLQRIWTFGLLQFEDLSFAFLNPSLQFVELGVEDVPYLINYYCNKKYSLTQPFLYRKNRFYVEIIYFVCIPGTHFHQGLSRPQGYVSVGRKCVTEKSSDTTGNFFYQIVLIDYRCFMVFKFISRYTLFGSRDLPTSSAAP